MDELQVKHAMLEEPKQVRQVGSQLRHSGGSADAY